MNPNDVAPLTGFLIACATLVLVLRGPVGQAFGRWVDRWGRRADPEADARLAEAEARIAELESSQMRTAELEERLEFAERLLAQQRNPAQLSEGGR